MKKSSVCLVLATLGLAACAKPPAPVAPPGPTATQFSVRTFGATGDGTTIDTPAISRAIDAASAVGGGTVVFPAGTYASYSIHLKSNITLYLDSGSTILAANPPDVGQPGGYDPPEPNPFDKYEDFGHAHWHNSLIWGEDLENVSIVGPGRIFGRGLSRGFGRMDPIPSSASLPKEKKGAVTPGVTGTFVSGPFGLPRAGDTLPSGVGNKSIALKNCRNVTLRDFTIFHGGHFAILALATDNLTIDNLRIDTNRDGMDIDCCHNVRVSNCAVNSPFDDAICPKASFGLGYPRMTENVTITNCFVSGYDEGTMLDGTRGRKQGYNDGRATGRIKCGTESNGGFKNITISNCVFEYCRGLALESVDGAVMEDITVSNITMRDIVNAPIFVRLGSRLRAPAGTAMGTARRIKIENVVAHNVAAQSGVLIVGTAGFPIEDLSLSNIFIDYAGGGTKAQGERTMDEDEQQNSPELTRRKYPEPERFGTAPAWGLFARHVKNFSVDHVEFRAAKDDLRPTVILDDVVDADFDRLQASHAAGAPTFVLKNVDGFVVHDSPVLPDTRRDQLVPAERL